MTLCATDLLNQAWDGALPVDPFALAQRLGFEVQAVFDLDGCSGEIRSVGTVHTPRTTADTIDARHVPRPATGTTVLRYDRTAAPTRQRFTVAHQIARVVLGHASSKTGTPTTSDRTAQGGTVLRQIPAHFASGTAQPEEAAANAFALELLMPEAMVRFVVLERGVHDVVKLSHVFGVSIAAMQRRLQALHLLPSRR